MSAVLNDYIPQENIMFSHKLRFNPELTFGEKVFLAEIQSMSQLGNPPELSSRRLSEMFGVSHQTIINWVKKLINMGLLEVESNNTDPYKKPTLKSKNRL